MQAGQLPRVAVVGAGIIGLGTASALLEASPRCDVTVIADKFTPDTTSDGAGGFWQPYFLSDTPIEKVRSWSSVTWDYLADFLASKDAGHAGVKLLSGYWLAQREQEDPDWKDQVIGYRDLTTAERKLYSNARWGRFYTSIQVDTRRMLPWLTKRINERGGKIVRRSLTSLDELAGHFDVVVNCSGIRSRHLANDSQVFPARGQIIKVQAPWLKHFFLVESEDRPELYILPGSDAVTIGGTFGVDDWRLEVDEKDKKAIWRRAVHFLPSLQDAKIDYDWVGLRPGRSQVRLEREEIRVNGKMLQVVHNYGHGGAGVTLFHGCALEAAHLVGQTLHLETPAARL